MKLSEKTLELNICAQVSQCLGQRNRVLWFGLTQKQEARAGFDACTKLGGRLIVFQFKASSRVLKSSERVFLAPHDQLMALQKHVGSHRRSVFYAFPLVGNTSELKANSDLLSQTWLVDVASLSKVGPPTKSDGSFRKNNCHNVYVTPGNAEFHSDPVAVKASNLRVLIEQDLRGINGINSAFGQKFEPFWEFAKDFSSGAHGLVLW